MDITLDDVEIAIKILYEFMKKQRQAQSILGRLSVSSGRGSPMGLSFEQIWNMAYQQVMAQKGVSVAEQKFEEPSLSEEELKRMREIAQKLMDKK